MAFLNGREPAANVGRSYARDLRQPTQWTNAAAERVYRNLIRPGTIVDMFLVEATPLPVSAAERAAYGEIRNVIEYRMWDVPGPVEDAQDYLVRHIARAKRVLGGVPA